MADNFLAEIRIFPFNFAPKGWAFCDGQLLPISQDTALFSLLGTTYGGNGTSNFALPNLQGSVPMQPGQGTGLSLYNLGGSGGISHYTLQVSELPSHTHSFQSIMSPGITSSPANGVFAADGTDRTNLYHSSASSNLAAMAAGMIKTAGGSTAHNNMQPYLTLNFCIALQGVFPSRP